MKKSRFTESQIVEILNVRKHGISTATYCSWKSKYAGMVVSELKRPHQLMV